MSNWFIIYLLYYVTELFKYSVVATVSKQAVMVESEN